MSEVSETFRQIVQADGEPPEAVWWFCRDGSVRRMTMTECDPRCDDCDCGYAAFMDSPSDEPLR